LPTIIKTPPFLFFLQKIKGALLTLQNLRRFFGRSKLDVTILPIIIPKGVINYELKFFQIDSFLALLEFLSALRKLIKLGGILQNSNL
jgi:hypothetical protein